MRCVTGIAVVTVVAAMAGSALGANIPKRDVFLNLDAGQLTIGGISEDGLTITPGQRVFFAEFGEAGVPNVTDEPGFQSLAGGLGIATSFRFDILRALRSWNGADFSTLAVESVTADLGPASVTSPSTDILTSGLAIPVNPAGSHEHPDWTLSAPASVGVYLLEINFSLSTGQVSEPVWLVWAQDGTADPVAEAAYDWAVANIPSPGVLALGGLLGLAGCRRRRTR